jgi:solute carrier family 25 folate transporter 32
LRPVLGAEHPIPTTIASAVVAGAVTNTLTNPCWVVRTRLQTQSHLGGGPPEYRSTLHAFQQIYRAEGFGALYKGLGASMLGLSHVAVQFPVYEALKTQLLPNGEGEQSQAQRIGALVSSSVISKLIATLITYPHDIARTRLHVERGAQAKGVFSMIKSIVDQEGFRGLYTGLGTQLVRVVPACAVTFTTFETLMTMLEEPT